MRILTFSVSQLCFFSKIWKEDEINLHKYVCTKWVVWQEYLLVSHMQVICSLHSLYSFPVHMDNAFDFMFSLAFILVSGTCITIWCCINVAVDCALVHLGMSVGFMCPYFMKTVCCIFEMSQSYLLNDTWN